MSEGKMHTSQLHSFRLKPKYDHKYNKKYYVYEESCIKLIQRLDITLKIVLTCNMRNAIQESYLQFNKVSRIQQSPFITAVPFSGEGDTVCCQQFMCGRGEREAKTQ